MTDHKQITMRLYNDYSGETESVRCDRCISSLIRQLYQAGYPTTMSCQNINSVHCGPSVWLSFDNAVAVDFVEMATKDAELWSILTSGYYRLSTMDWEEQDALYEEELDDDIIWLTAEEAAQYDVVDARFWIPKKNEAALRSALDRILS